MAPAKKIKKTIKRQELITAYMDYVLEEEKVPTSVFKFAKAVHIEEQAFYEHFGSIEGIKSGIWETFYTLTMDAAHKNDEYAGFSTREKMLTFFYTFFELLTMNRSYVLFALHGVQNNLSNMKELKSLRSHIKDFASSLIAERNESKTNLFLEKSERLYSEGAWVQFLFLLKFWMDDNSPQFEKTDMAIEKSVNTIFDVFDNTPLEAVIDFGKFLWKEKMN